MSIAERISMTLPSGMAIFLESWVAVMRAVLLTMFAAVWLVIAPRVVVASGILVVGDSLSAGYGLEQQQVWVTLLRDRLASAGYSIPVVNASITGDTTRGGLARLPAALTREEPDLVVIALGGNDGLRGFAPDQTRRNLREMIHLSRKSGADVLLLGVKLPANYGKTFGEKFHRVYLDLAAELDVPLVPFFLEGVAETRDLMQPDGIHPSAAAQPRILDNVWQVLAPLLRDKPPGA
jgi:acyl-CoA thioesterase-1